ncbi:MAG: SCO family protein [Chitinophagaceae bacterium]
MKSITILFLAAILLQGCTGNTNNPDKAKAEVAKETAKAPLPDGSIFNIKDTFTTQHNTPMQLVSLQGKPTLIAMIFSNCGYACPRLTADMKAIHDKLGAKANQVNFVLVSFDVARDTPARLEAYTKEQEMTPDWILLHGGEQTVRTLSVLLNVQYEKDAEGNFSHSNLISVLDKNGVLAFQKEGIDADHTETMSTLQKMLQ